MSRPAQANVRRSQSRNQTVGQSARKNEQCDAHLASDILLTASFRFLIACGVSRRELGRMLRKHARLIEGGGTLEKPESPSYQMMVRISGLVHDWSWQRGYADSKTGVPRALHLEGPGSNLRELIERRFPDQSVENVLTWMEDNGVVARQLDGTFVLTRRSVLVNGSRTLSIERIATLASEYLDTGLRNINERDKHCTQPDRIARVFHLPKKYRGQFRQVVQEQMQSYLEIIDSWLESRNDPDSREPCIEAGVHSYMFVDDRRNRGRTQRPKRRK